MLCTGTSSGSDRDELANSAVWAWSLLQRCGVARVLRTGAGKVLGQDGRHPRGGSVCTCRLSILENRAQAIEKCSLCYSWVDWVTCS